jgi:hypothetical protein
MDVFIALLPILGLALFASLAAWYNLWRIDRFLKKSEKEERKVS